MEELRDAEQDEVEWVDDDEYDEASVPVWQSITTMERKKLKMKKHQRAKRKKKMLIKLKWSGKL